MKITLSSATLLKHLQFLGAVIPSKSTIAILENFLFDIDVDQLTITASDLETTLSTKIDIQSSEKGLIAVPAKMLLEILKALPDQPLDFEVLENNLIEIKSAQGNYSIAYQNGNEFPKLEVVSSDLTITMPADVLATAITKTIFATGTDDLRPVMTGVLFQFSSEGANFVATDAHKLVKYSRADIQTSEAIDFIVPKKPLGLLKSILPSASGEVSIDYNNSNAVFEMDGYKLSCRLIDAKYPNYQAVIPKENPNVLIIGRARLLNSLKCVSIFSNRLTSQVRLKMSGSELNLSAEDIDYSNKADERLTCDYQGDDMKIGFNAKFLIEMLSNLSSDDVSIEMSEPKRAGILKPVTGMAEGESILMLVMPTLIND